MYELARGAKHRELRRLLHEDVRWEPARAGAWKPCANADEVVRTLLWRAGVNRMRPGDLIDLGDRVVVQVRGRGLARFGARGLFPQLYQIVVVRDGRVASIQDFSRRTEAFTAAGLRA